MTDEQQQALHELAKELRILAHGASVGADLAEGKVEGLDMVNDPRDPALPEGFIELTRLDLRARLARVERALTAARATFAPGPLRLVSSDES